MPFPRQLLADHEEIVFDLKPHWVAVVPSVLWTVAALIILFGGYWTAEQIFDNDPTGAKTVVGAVVTIAWVVLAVAPFLRWRFTLFVLTTDRLITRSGIIAKNSKEIPLERINDVAFSQSILERIVGAGDLLVESAGERGQTRITSVRKPEEVQLMIYKEVESNQQKGASSVPEQIQALHLLYEQGVLSKDEYEQKKQEMLKRL